MKRTFCIFLTALMLLGMLAGCQKTPEAPLVVGKNLDRLIETVQEEPPANENATNEETTTPNDHSALIKRLNISERFISSIEKATIRVDADTEISLPNANRMPMVRVAPADFSQDVVTKLWDYLVGNKTMYQVQERLSKAQIEEELLYYRKVLSGAEFGSPEYAEQQINLLNQAYDTAPETLESNLANSELKLIKEYDQYDGSYQAEYMGVNAAESPIMFFGSQSGLVFQVKNNYAGNGEVQITEDVGGWKVNDTASRGATFYFSNNDILTDRFYFHDIGFVSQETDMKSTYSYHEAIAYANDLLNSIGVSNDMAIDESRITASYMFDKEMNPIKLGAPKETMDFSNKLESGDLDEAIQDIEYVIPCVRKINNVLVKSEGGASSIGDPDFGKGSWEYELLIIKVCGQGVVEVNWNSPYELKDFITEDAKLLSYDAIKAIFDKMVCIVYDFHEVSCRVEVTGVSLSLRRIMEQGSLENGLLVPAWTFYGGVFTKRNMGSDQYEWHQENKTTNIVLLVNAIDGSIIDRALGY